MGIIKNFDEYENLHKLCEEKSLSELSNHPNIKEIELINDIITEGYFGDLISNWKDSVLNSITKKIPGAAMNKISKLLKQYDEVFFKPKIAEDIDLLKQRYLKLYGKEGASKEEKKDRENGQNFKMTVEAWSRRMDANKKKWEAKEKELGIEKKHLQEKYKDNHRITKAFGLALAELEFERYKEAEEKYKSLLLSHELADAEKDKQEKINKVTKEKKEVEDILNGKESEDATTDGKETIEGKDVKVGQVWQTKDGKEITIASDLETSKKKIAELKAKGHDIKKKGYIAKTSDGKTIIVSEDELVSKIKDPDKTSIEKIKDIQDNIDRVSGEKEKAEKDSDEMKNLEVEGLKLEIEKGDLEKGKDWDSKKAEIERKIDRLQSDINKEYNEGDLLRFYSNGEKKELIRKAKSISDDYITFTNIKGAEFDISKEKIKGKVDSGEDKIKSKSDTIKSNIGKEISEEELNSLVDDIISINKSLIQTEGEIKMRKTNRIDQLIDYAKDILDAKKAGKKLSEIKKAFMLEYKPEEK